MPALKLKAFITVSVSAGIVLGLIPSAHAGLVQFIDADQAASGKAPRINVCGEGGGFNLSMLDMPGLIAGGWLDDKSRVSIDFDSDINSSPAKIVHLKRIDQIDFPGQPATDTTLLSIHTTTGKLLRFEIGYTCPNNYDTGIVVSSDEVKKAKRDRIPRKTQPLSKGGSKEQGKIDPTKSRIEPNKKGPRSRDETDWILPTEQYLFGLSSKGPTWSPYLQKTVDEVPLVVPDSGVDDLGQPEDVAPESFNSESIEPLEIGGEEISDVPSAPVKQDFAPEVQTDLGLELLPETTAKVERPQPERENQQVKDMTSSSILELSPSKMAWYLSRGLFNASLKGHINRGTTAHQLWNSIIARVRGGQDLTTAIQHVVPIGEMSDFQRVGVNLLRMGGLN